MGSQAMHHDVFFPLGISIRSLDNGRPRTTEETEHPSSEDEGVPSTRTPATSQTDR